MAKLTGPLFSLKAAGAIGKALTYANWKGIDYGKTYAVPANPNTGLQQTQRGYLTSALSWWHDTTNVLTAIDKANLDRKAGVQASALSGFNQYVRQYINSKVAGATPLQLYGEIESDKKEGQVTVIAKTPGNTTNVKMRWGYSATALVNLITRSEPGADTEHTFVNTVATEGQVVFYEIYDLTASSVFTLGVGRIVVEAAP